jgi:hypothetical protein
MMNDLRIFFSILYIARKVVRQQWRASGRVPLVSTYFKKKGLMISYVIYSLLTFYNLQLNFPLFLYNFLHKVSPSAMASIEMATRGSLYILALSAFMTSVSFPVSPCTTCMIY